MLTLDRLKQCVSYDPETGVFIRLLTRWPSMVGRVILGSGKKYRFIRIDGKFYAGHRLAWFWVFGELPPDCIDHIDGDGKNNRITNLRLADLSINSQNLRRPKKLASDIPLGVTKRHGNYRAQIRPENGRNMHIGTFSTAEEAHEAYLEAKRRLHRGCTL